jgi:hypothetical protein
MSDPQRYLVDRANRFREHKRKQGPELADRVVRFPGNAGRLGGCFQNIIVFC